MPAPITTLSLPRDKNKKKVKCYFSFSSFHKIFRKYYSNQLLSRSWGHRQSLRLRRCGDPHYAINLYTGSITRKSDDRES